MHLMARLEYEPKSCVISAQYIKSPFLRNNNCILWFDDSILFDVIPL